MLSFTWPTLGRQRISIGLLSVSFPSLIPDLKQEAAIELPGSLDEGRCSFFSPISLAPDAAPEISLHIAAHVAGDHDIALRAHDARAAFYEASRRRGRAVEEPR